MRSALGVGEEREEGAGMREGLQRPGKSSLYKAELNVIGVSSL